MAGLTAQSGAVVDSAGTQLGGDLQKRLAAVRVKYARDHDAVADDVGKLTQTYPPSKFAFGAILMTAIAFDVVNYIAIWLDVAAGVGILIDAVLSVVFLFCVRSLINRPMRTQIILGLLIGAALILMIFFGAIGGSLLAYILLVPVIYMGIRNPGVRVGVVDKESIQKSIQQFEKTVERAKNVVSRFANLGRKTKGLKTIASTTAKLKPLKAAAGSSKVMRNLFMTRAGEIIPGLSLVPFNIISTIMTYNSLKKDDLSAKELHAEYEERRSAARTLEAGVLQEQYQAQMAGVILEIAGQEPTSNVSAPLPGAQRRTEVLPSESPAPRKGLADVRAVPARASV